MSTIEEYRRGEDPDFGWFTVWVDQHLGLALTFARGLSPERMLGWLGINPSDAVVQTFEEAEGASQWSKPRIRVGHRNGWAYSVESFTYLGSRQLGRLSLAGGQALSLTYTMKIDYFEHWENGEQVSNLDLGVPHIRWSRDPRHFDALIEQAGFLRPGPSDPSTMGARLLQLAFGITIDLDMIVGPLLSAEIDWP